jgi:hypothetical protein
MKKEIELPESLTKKLLALPETGMGFQKVTLTLKNGNIKRNITVLNSSIAILEEEIEASEIADVELSEKE